MFAQILTLKHNRFDWVIILEKSIPLTKFGRNKLTT